MASAEDARTKAAATYNAAADRYDDPENSFWERFGRATIERLALRSGEHVIDACCGSGASALPAAVAVSPTGSVLGIDLAERLLELARAKAEARGLSNVEFRTGDLLDLPVPDRHFDAAVCVFGVFFVPEIPAAIRELWRTVRPGGRLAVTTWGPRFFEPATSEFWRSVRAVRPELEKSFHPWDRICDPASLRAVFAEAGIGRIEVVAEPGAHPIPSPEAWWSAVVGLGYRGTIDLLQPEELRRVRADNLDAIRRLGIRSVEANVVYATATKD